MNKYLTTLLLYLLGMAACGQNKDTVKLHGFIQLDSNTFTIDSTSITQIFALSDTDNNYIELYYGDSTLHIFGDTMKAVKNLFKECFRQMNMVDSLQRLLDSIRSTRNTINYATMSKEKKQMPEGIRVFNESLPSKVRNKGTDEAMIDCEICGAPVYLTGHHRLVSMHVFVYPDAPYHTTKGLCCNCLNIEYKNHGGYELNTHER